MQVSEFKEAFELFANGKTTISKDTCRTLFKQYGVRISDEEFAAAFKEVDTTQNGEFAFPEFLTMMGRKMGKTSSEEKLLSAFQAFDEDKKLFIPTDVLKTALTTLGNPLTAKEMHEFLAIAETVPGEVRYQQFINALFMKK